MCLPLQFLKTITKYFSLALFTISLAFILLAIFTNSEIVKFIGEIYGFMLLVTSVTGYIGQKYRSFCCLLCYNCCITIFFFFIVLLTCLLLIVFR